MKFIRTYKIWTCTRFFLVSFDITMRCTERSRVAKCNLRCFKIMYGKNDFAEGSKILLDTNLKIILLDHQNNFVETLKIINFAKNFNILATGLSVLYYYFDSSTKLLFYSLYPAKIFQQNRTFFPCGKFI